MKSVLYIIAFRRLTNLPETRICRRKNGRVLQKNLKGMQIYAKNEYITWEIR